MPRTGGIEALFRLLAAAGLFVLATLLSSGFSRGGTDWDLPAPYRGGADWPRELIGPLDRSVRGEYYALQSSYANPYGIDELDHFRAALAVRRERFGVHAAWMALVHPRYRGDRLEARLCRAIAPLPLALAAAYAIERSVVTGFPAVHASEWAAAAVVVGQRWALALGAESGGGEGAAPVSFGCSADLGPLAVVMSGEVSAGISAAHVAARLELDEALWLSLGYRARTNELCYGLECRRRRLLVAVGWRDHPALGRTGVVGAGWIWQR